VRDFGAVVGLPESIATPLTAAGVDERNTSDGVESATEPRFWLDAGGDVWRDSARWGVTPLTVAAAYERAVAVRASNYAVTALGHQATVAGEAQ
jgi:hypothetical protein